MRRLLIGGAGGGGSNNLIRAMRRLPEGEGLHLVGVNADEFALARSLTDRSYLVPHSSDPAAYLEGLAQVARAESVDLLVPTNDTEVAVLSRHRDALEVPVLLPPPSVVEACVDKARFGRTMREAGVAVPRAITINDLDEVPGVWEALGGPDVVWLRLRSGNGSRGTLPVRAPEQAASWIRYWSETRGVAPTDFVFNEFLPGRDFAFEGIWRDGRLLAGKTAHRVRYLFGNNVPSGTLSTPSLARLVAEPAVVQACEAAVEALDPAATGVFSIDLKEDAQGRPNLTEINVARFFRISPIFNLSGSVNLAGVYLDVAAGRDPELPPERRLDDGVEDDVYWICDIDGVPSVITRAEIDAKVRRCE